MDILNKSINISIIFFLSMFITWLMVFNKFHYEFFAVSSYIVSILVRNKVIHYFGKQKFIFWIADFFVLVYSISLAVSLLVMSEYYGGVQFITCLGVFICEVFYSNHERPLKLNFPNFWHGKLKFITWTSFYSILQMVIWYIAIFH